MSNKCIIGFDLGGTKMLSAVISPEGSILARSKRKTLQITSEEALVRKIIQTIEDSLQKASISGTEVAGVGLAVPGLVDLHTGHIAHLPNLNLSNLDIRKKVAEYFKVPVVIENDVNAGLYGEFRFGSVRKARHIIGLFIGTGIGGGMILNGELYRGAKGAAGEIGHIILQTDGPATTAGINGTFEGLASKTALAKDLVMLSAAGYAPTVFKHAGTDISKIRSSVIKKALDAEEAAVMNLIDRSIRYLGIGMATCVQIFNPELIILGGGIVQKLGKTYVEKAITAMKAHCMPELSAHVKVISASLGDDAVPLGVSALVHDYLQGREQ